MFILSSEQSLKDLIHFHNIFFPTRNTRCTCIIVCARKSGFPPEIFHLERIFYIADMEFLSQHSILPASNFKNNDIRFEFA